MTVLECLSSVESCRQWLSTEPGVAELLVQYLHEKPRSGATTIEKSACERLQQRSSVAISRLSHSYDVGLIFVELHCKLHCHLLVAGMIVGMGKMWSRKIFGEIAVEATEIGAKYQPFL